MSGARFKTRSSLYLYKMSDDVKAKLEEKEKATNIAKWLIVEKVLEDYFGLDSNDGINLEKFLGVTPQRAKVGKPRKKIIKK